MTERRLTVSESSEHPESSGEKFLNPVAGFGVTFKAMFKKRLTEQYPETQKVTAPRFHGRHQLNRHPDGLEKCVGCELCAWACPRTPSTWRARTTPTRSATPRGALRPRLPDQLRALHPVRALHRGVPHPGTDHDERVRARQHHPREPDLHQGRAARGAGGRHGRQPARDLPRHGRTGLLPGPGDRGRVRYGAPTAVSKGESDKGADA